MATMRMMSGLRSRSTHHPERGGAARPAALPLAVADVACRLIARAEAMGVVEPAGSAGYTHDLLDAALTGLAQHGIGRRSVHEAQVGGDLRRALEALDAEVVESPLPPTEWRSMLALFTRPEDLGSLLGVSASSVQRYAAGTRATPDDVALRLHWLALVVADLSGSYNSFGIRRWFQRPRSRLKGSAPSGVLTEGWDPEDSDARAVADLARELTTPFST